MFQLLQAPSVTGVQTIGGKFNRSILKPLSLVNYDTEDAHLSFYQTLALL